MKFIKEKTIYTVLSLIVALLAVPSAVGDELGDVVRTAIRKVEPSIVRLRVIGGEQSIDGNAVRSLVTTGLVISENGEILTSQFALEGKPEAVLIEDQSGKRTSAVIVATDNVRRIVLLKANEGQWIAAVPSNNRLPQVGQWSVALGRFYAAESSSVSVGIISALNRIHGMAIQTDAKVSPVNYGGPLVSLAGDVLGILVPLSPRGGGSATSGVEWYDSGIGFAIPFQDALASAAKLRLGKDLKFGRIGIRLVPAGAFDTRVEIDRVHPGGPAERAGLRKGDTVLAIDNQVVDRSSVMMDLLARHYAGDSVAVRVRRGDEVLTVPVELAEALPPVAKGYLGLIPIRLARPRDASDTGKAAKADDGKEVPEDTPQTPRPRQSKAKEAERREESDSVSLLVMNDSPAASGALPSSIRLLSVNGTKTDSVAALGAAVEDLTPGTVVKLEYRGSDAGETQTSVLTASSRNDAVVELSEKVLVQLQQMGPAMKELDAAIKNVVPRTEGAVSDHTVSRQELDFGERGRSVVLSSSQPSDVMPGIVILLAAQSITEEEVVRQWGPFLHSRCLSVAIPKNPESARLTSEDIPLVLTTIRAMVSQAGGDLQRVVVVADQSQAPLAWQCTFGGPSGIRGIALTDGWYSSSEIQNSDGAGHSVLLLDPAETIQARALIDLSRKSLNAAGFWAPLPVPAADGASASTDLSAFRVIADWTLQLRSF